MKRYPKRLASKVFRSIAIGFLLLFEIVSSRAQEPPELINPIYGTGTLFDVGFIDEQHGFLISGDHAFESFDGGVTWSELLFLGGDELKIVGATIGILSDESLQLSTNEGLLWNVVYGVESFEAIYDFSLTSDGTLFLTESDGLFKSPDGGLNWTAQPTPGFVGYSVHFFNSQEGLVGGSDGRLYRTSDGAQTYEVVYEDQFNAFNASDFAFPTEQVGYACGSNGRVFKTDDAGMSWSLLSVPNLHYNAVDFLNEDLGVIVAEDGSVIRTVNGGLDWETIELMDSWSSIHGVSFVNEDECLATGPGSRLFRSSDQGATWVQQSCNVDEIMAMDVFSDEKIYFLGEDEVAVLNSDGEACEVLSTIWTSWNDGHDIEMISENLGYAIFEEELLKRTVDGGLTWEQVNYGPDDFCDRGFDLTFAYGNLYLSAPCDNRFFTSTDLGYTWTMSDQNTPLGNVHVLSEDVIYIYPFGVGSWGVNISKSTDGGASWESMSMPETPLYSAYFVNEDVGYAGCGNDLFKTTDGGENWTMIPEPDDGSFTTYNDIAFVDENRGWIIDFGSQIYETIDGGNTWTSYNALSFVRELERFGQALYAGGVQGAIYKKDFSNVLSTALPKPTNGSGISVYPNPIESHFTLEMTEGKEAVRCNFLLPDGRFAAVERFEKPCSSCRMTSPENLASGVYLMQVESLDGKFYMKRIVIE